MDLSTHPSNKPILDSQSFDTTEFIDIAGDQHRIKGECMRGN